MPKKHTFKLLPLHDSEHVTDYLPRFERGAAMYKLNDKEKAVYLASLLQNRTLTIYSILDDDTTKSFKLLKQLF